MSQPFVAKIRLPITCDRSIECIDHRGIAFRLIHQPSAIDGLLDLHRCQKSQRLSPIMQRANPHLFDTLMIRLVRVGNHLVDRK